MADTTLIAFRLDSKTLSDLKKVARKEDRTVSSYLRLLVKAAVDAAKAKR